MATVDSIRNVHGRRAARAGLRVSPLLWPLAAMIVMVPVLVFLIISIVT